LVVIVAVCIELAGERNQVRIGLIHARETCPDGLICEETMIMPVVASILVVTCAPVTSTARCWQSGYQDG
jgi:hypothetical protein